MPAIPSTLKRLALTLGAFGSLLLMSASPITHAATAASTASTNAQTKYPIVLVHGFMGFDRLLGTDYWYQIPPALRKQGAKVYVAEVSQINGNEVRGEQLLRQIQAWAARDGFTKVNLIGHSQGGPTARYVAGVAPELVASITTMASPHTISETEAGDNAVAGLLKQPKFALALAKTIAFLSGGSANPQDINAFSGNFAIELQAFNQRFPLGLPTEYCGAGPAQAGGIYFFSASGSQGKTNAWDISDSIMLDKPDSDGIVPRCSSHLGTVIKDNYPWNHLDEINQVWGTIGKGAPDPVAFYVQQANRLKGLGL